MDFYKPLTGGRRPEGHYLKLAKYATLVWGAILFGVALVARNWGSVLQAGLSIASILYGSLLGVFLLGLLTKRVGENAAMAGMIASLSLTLYIKFFTQIAWTWYVLIGTTAAVVAGCIGSLFERPALENPPSGNVQRTKETPHA